MRFVTIEIRPHGAATRQFFDCWGMTFYFRECRARRQSKLFGEDVKDAGETNQRRKFRDRARREVLQVEFALRGRHAADLTTMPKSVPPASAGGVKNPLSS